MTGVDPEATGAPQLPGGAPDDAPGTPVSAVDATPFAHASEAEMARILDFYDVRWEYEPTTFPILWNLDGEVIESFAPDFYLPELEVFLEMTTLKQRLVRKKNRKLRRLRELYPDIRIKLFYARDFRAMMLKYGRFWLAESLSGTPGQVMRDRVVADVVKLVSMDDSPSEPLLVVEPAPSAPFETARSVAPPVSRATPRARSGRRRRRIVGPTQTGAEREAGA